MKTIIIVGSGSFGTAMAERLSWNRNNTVILYNRDESVVKEINTTHRNRKYFPTRFLNTAIRATTDRNIFSHADDILLAIPAKAIVPFTHTLKGIAREECLFVNLAKGLSGDGAFITEKIPFPRTAGMKGPSFAIEVLNGLPTAFTFGGRKEDYESFRTDLEGTALQIDYARDVRSVELLSILKNMYAIAIGVVSGKYNSPNVDFLLYTKAVKEMRKFLTLFRCDTSTIFRFCGIGDLGLTSLNDLSRNRTLGLLIGKGFVPDENGASSTIVEGYRTVLLMYQKLLDENAARYFPIASALYRLLYEKEDVNTYSTAVLSN